MHRRSESEDTTLRTSFWKRKLAMTGVQVARFPDTGWHHRISFDKKSTATRCRLIRLCDTLQKPQHRAELILSPWDSPYSIPYKGTLLDAIYDPFPHIPLHSPCVVESRKCALSVSIFCHGGSDLHSEGIIYRECGVSHVSATISVVCCADTLLSIFDAQALLPSSIAAVPAVKRVLDMLIVATVKGVAVSTCVNAFGISCAILIP